MTNDEFIRMVLYYQGERGDPTRFGGWSEERCQELMPAFYKVWKERQILDEIMSRIITSYGYF